MYRFPLGGIVLGPFPSPSYENVALDIADGDRLVLYTDGVIEAMGKTGELFGDDRLVAFIREHSSDSAEHTADQLIDYVSRWSGRSGDLSFEDDLTLVIVDLASSPEV